ncbi:MAG: helix-turn-helix domain-containing protein [Niabella sp.]
MDLFSLSLSPHNALKSLIKRYHYQHIDLSSASAMKYDFYPSYSQCLMLYLGDAGSRMLSGEDICEIKAGPHIVSAQLKTTTLYFQNLHRVFTVNFTAGGLSRLLKQPLNDLVNICADAESFMGYSIQKLTDRLRNAILIEDLKHIADRFFLDRLNSIRPPKSFDIVMQQVSDNLWADYNVEAIARASCLSIKQVDRLSYERFGISPKLYLKLIRFSKACTIKEKFPGLSWTKIAYQSGYYDQNHFIKDFRKFTGITPAHSNENLINRISFRRHIE